MNDILKALANLLKIRSLIALAIVGTVIYLTLTGKIEVALITAAASSVISYFFNTDD